jgi:hypothetical protein
MSDGEMIEGELWTWEIIRDMLQKVRFCVNREPDRDFVLSALAKCLEVLPRIEYMTTDLIKLLDLNRLHLDQIGLGNDDIWKQHPNPRDLSEHLRKICGEPEGRYQMSKESKTDVGSDMPGSEIDSLAKVVAETVAAIVEKAKRNVLEVLKERIQAENERFAKSVRDVIADLVAIHNENLLGLVDPEKLMPEEA